MYECNTSPHIIHTCKFSVNTYYYTMYCITPIRTFPTWFMLQLLTDKTNKKLILILRFL
jgi:hypothetical protein